MNTFFRIELNLVSMVMLGIVFYLAYLRLDRSDAFNRVFFKGCLLIVILTGFEAFTCMVNGQTSWVPILVSNLMHICLFAFPPLMTCYWYLLSDALTLHGSAREMKVNRYLLIPVAANALIAVLSPVFHLDFYIDASGIYHRGPLFWLTAAIAFAYLAAGFHLLVKRRKCLMRRELSFLMIFCLLPLVGGIFQGLFYGVLLMWPLSALALVILYLYLQERMMQTDGLTGAWTRNSFEYHVSQNLKGNNKKPFGIIYADIDNLKPINDRYGHPEGDTAIRAAASAMKTVLRKGDSIARLGGDEFVIQLNVSTREDLTAVTERIKAAMEEYNSTSGKPYKLSCSFGADLFYESTESSVESIIRHVDYLMYSNKRRKKAEAGIGEPFRESVME